MSKNMTLQHITARSIYLASLPMGPERWEGESKLRDQKANCLNYRHSSQQIPFREWIARLATASKQFDVKWGTDKIRADYYEGQPEIWVDYYDKGLCPTDAIVSDMESWD